MRRPRAARARLRGSRRRALRRLHGDSVSFHRLVMSAALAGGIACAAPLAVARRAGSRRRRCSSPSTASTSSRSLRSAPACRSHFTVFGTPRRARHAADRRRPPRPRAARDRARRLRRQLPHRWRDAVRPESRVTATLQKNGAVAYAALDEPLLLARGTVPWDVAASAGGEATPRRSRRAAGAVPARNVARAATVARRARRRCRSRSP